MCSNSTPNPSETIAVGDTAAGETNSILSALSAEFDASVPSLVASEPERGHATARSRRSRRTDGNGHAEVPITKEPAGPLGEVFDQFRADMGENSAEGEDLETHYNLGIAYREMGLLEEAISEFQKVAKANKQGRPFRYAMQCCTLLGLAFMERGQPSIAAAWYERALETAALDPETVLALRYDLGVAQELAGDTSAARKSFSQVYGVNIDYRDVGRSGWQHSEKNASVLMHTLLRIICMIMLFELGMTLVVLPWLAPGPWDANYFLSHYPALRPYLLQRPAVRGPDQ